MCESNEKFYQSKSGGINFGEIKKDPMDEIVFKKGPGSHLECSRYEGTGHRREEKGWRQRQKWKKYQINRER